MALVLQVRYELKFVKIVISYVYVLFLWLFVYRVFDFSPIIALLVVYIQ